MLGALAAKGDGIIYVGGAGAYFSSSVSQQVRTLSLAGIPSAPGDLLLVYTCTRGGNGATIMPAGLALVDSFSEATRPYDAEIQRKTLTEAVPGISFTVLSLNFFAVAVQVWRNVESVSDVESVLGDVQQVTPPAIAPDVSDSMVVVGDFCASSLMANPVGLLSPINAQGTAGVAVGYLRAESSTVTPPVWTGPTNTNDAYSNHAFTLALRPR